MIKITKDLGVRVHLTFILGLKGETSQSIQETVSFIKEVEPYSFQLSFATPFPGTELFNYVKENGYLVSDYWADYDGNSRCIIKTEDLSNMDLERALIDIRNSFNLQ